MLGFFGCCAAAGTLTVDMKATSETNEPSQILLFTSIFQLLPLATCVRRARSSINHHVSTARWRLAAAAKLTCYSLFYGKDRNGALALNFEFAQRLAFEAIPDLKPSFIAAPLAERCGC
jgi:hypothetical protein